MQNKNGHHEDVTDAIKAPRARSKADTERDERVVRMMLCKLWE